ncbi:anaerobic sulfatase maturase [Alkalitalea saponilacus]|uniref:Radical SAM core domain-containing protein n=1 Tax=Alkalitalea saponilacus TaxID=889453 RepID=A0A1T5HMN6_9BACT|nr:anaerobic sulfatase maturase [Alkalitalea saponilacus]ASB49388.1 anaerobic sulfatase maturase [Alkalitalea saponilacus]SKC21919.1 uncharacterized protein SAMN03080601_02474 [Alkalitalea saponilacus]
MNNLKPLNSVLVKPAGPDCNLNCTYCFYLEKAELYSEAKTHRMSYETLEVLIRQVMAQSGSHVSFTWQGGEPTLIGLGFYEKVIELQKKYGRGKVIGNGLQTNGMLIDEKWAAFLAEHNFLIGLSIDGPRHIHNHYRKLSNGSPSWDRVYRSLCLLKEQKVAVNAMSCVTSYSAQYAEDTYNFFKNEGFEWMQFIPIVETSRNGNKYAADFSVNAEDYGYFLIDLFDLWVNDFVNDEPTTHIREFESLFYTYVGMQAPECYMQAECGTYPTVEHNGDVYACDFFVETKWKLGNIHTTSLIELLNSQKQKQFGKLKSVLPPKCKRCSWYRHCLGGCTKDRVKDIRDSGMPRFCRSTKMFLEHADGFYKNLAEKWHIKQNRNPLDSYKTYNAFGDFME